jgi:hypothetical protein
MPGTNRICSPVSGLRPLRLESIQRIVSPWIIGLGMLVMILAQSHLSLDLDVMILYQLVAKLPLPCRFSRFCPDL